MKDFFGWQENAGGGRPPRSIRGHRDRSILELLYSMGMRKGELVAVNVVDFSVERYELAILKNKARNPGCCLVTKAVAIPHRGEHAYQNHA